MSIFLSHPYLEEALDILQHVDAAVAEVGLLRHLHTAALDGVFTERTLASLLHAVLDAQVVANSGDDARPARASQRVEY